MTYNELDFNEGSVWIFMVLQDSPVPEGVDYLKNTFLLFQFLKGLGISLKVNTTF